MPERGELYRTEGRLQIPFEAGYCPRCKEEVLEADWKEHVLGALDGKCPLRREDGSEFG